MTSKKNISSIVIISIFLNILSIYLATGCTERKESLKPQATLPKVPAPALWPPPQYDWIKPHFKEYTKIPKPEKTWSSIFIGKD